jgi:MFS family permease
MSSTWFFAAFSASLIVSASMGPRAGRTVDALGGREVLAVSNVILASGLAVLAFADSQPILWLAWPILGLGMGIGLYDTAFAEDAEPSEMLDWSVETGEVRNDLSAVSELLAFIESQGALSIIMAAPREIASCEPFRVEADSAKCR